MASVTTSIQRAARAKRGKALARPLRPTSAIPHLKTPSPTLADTLPIWCVVVYRQGTGEWYIVKQGLTEAEALSRASTMNRSLIERFAGAPLHLTYHRVLTRIARARHAGTWESDEGATLPLTAQPGEQSA